MLTIIKETANKKDEIKGLKAEIKDMKAKIKDLKVGDLAHIIIW